MDTFLQPIEKPQGLMMKLAYFFTRKQFGKVLTPLKVYSARLPIPFAFFYQKIGKLDKKLTLPFETIMLIREQVARINICLFCVDIGRMLSIRASLNEEKFNSLENYKTSALFSVKERAALDYVTLLTREKRMDKETFSKLKQHYSEKEICEIVYLVSTEHVYNMTNIGLNIHSDMLCDLDRKKG